MNAKNPPTIVDGDYSITDLSAIISQECVVNDHGQQFKNYFVKCHNGDKITAWLRALLNFC